MSGRTAVVIVDYGSIDLIERNAAALDAAPDSLIVVVDCFSSLAERTRVDAVCRARDWVCVLLEDNRGFGGGMNAGARRAIALGADVIVALNPDAAIDRDALETLAAAARAQPTALVWPRIVDSDGRTWFRGSDLYLDDGSIVSIGRRRERDGRPRHEWATGACFAISVTLWERVGGFDEDYFLYWEDVDLSRRVLDAGGSVLPAAARAVHDEGRTHDSAATGGAKSETYYYYNIRNRLLYARKHGDPALIRSWRRASLRVSWGILLQGGRRQLLTSLAPWRALSHGLRDARHERWGARRD